MTKGDLKIEGKQILWWNGEKWLVKETFSTIKKAKEFLYGKG